MQQEQTAAGFDRQRKADVEELLVGAIDPHCRSAPAAMPRILDHHEAMMDWAAFIRKQAVRHPPLNGCANALAPGQDRRIRFSVILFA
jgi:hypothetical protein